MVRVPLGRSSFTRSFGRQADVTLLNRYFEQNPSNQTDGIALLSRPGNAREADFGNGPIRKQFNLPGLFNYDNFIISDQTMYRYSAAAVTTAITGSVGLSGQPSMAGVKGAAYERIFIADGTSLQYYGGQAYSAVLNYTAGAISDDVVVIDGVYYAFAAAGLDTGAPAGTLANPWKVLSTGTAAQSLQRLRDAVNATGVAGTDYSTALTANPRVTANANTATSVSVRGRVPGALDPVAAVSVTVTGGADGLAWDHSPLAAGAHVLYGVVTPDSVGMVSVAELGSFVLCVKALSQRVYFIRPGETTIDALDFFEAESETDNLLEVVTVGDQVWLVGQKSIEPWYLNGSTDPLANPFSRVQGRPFSIGAIEGTVVKLANSVILVGNDGIVYRIEGGPTPISNPAIAEHIRKALKAEKDAP